MKAFILDCFLSLFASCNSNSPFTPFYQDTKMTLEQKEKANPLAFLSAAGTYRKNLISEWVLEGSITNTATLATYKDIVLRIFYYSKTKTVIGTEQKTIFDFFKPNNTQKFKIKSFGFEGTESLGFQVLSASPAN